MALMLEWTATGGAAQNPPDKRFPLGVDLDLAGGAVECCVTTLPYPASGIGFHLIRCLACELKVAASAAGRPDDPRTVRVACKRAPADAVKRPHVPMQGAPVPRDRLP